MNSDTNVRFGQPQGFSGEDFKTQNDRRSISNIIKNFKGFDPNAIIMRRDFNAIDASKLNKRLTFASSNPVDIPPTTKDQKKDKDDLEGNTEVKDESNPEIQNSSNFLGDELFNENPDITDGPKENGDLDDRTLNFDTLSSSTSPEKFLNEMKKKYTDLRGAYISRCGGRKCANPEILRVIDAKLGDSDAGIKSSSYWQRHAESRDFKDIKRMCNLDLCGGSLHYTYGEDWNDPDLPKKWKTIFDEAVNGEKLVDLRDFEREMDDAVESYNIFILNKLNEGIEFDLENYENTRAKIFNYFKEYQKDYPHGILDEEKVRADLGLERGFINKDISKLKEGLKEYPAILNVVNAKLVSLKRCGKSSSLRTEAKRIMDKAYQIKAQLDELARLRGNEGNGENKISPERCTELENELIGLFRRSANNSKDFTAELNKIKAEINKEKVKIENKDFIENKIKSFSSDFEEGQISQPQQGILGSLRKKLGELGNDGSVELSKNKDAEKLIARAERIAKEINGLDGSGFEEMYIPIEQDEQSSLQDTKWSVNSESEEARRVLIASAKQIMSDYKERYDKLENQDLSIKTVKDLFERDLNDIFELHANQKDFDRELNKVLVRINQAKMIIDNEKFVDEKVGEFDREVKKFYPAIEVNDQGNQNDDENQALGRGDNFDTEVLRKSLKKFAQGKKGEVVSLREAVGATGVLNRGKQITDTLESLKNHINAGELSVEERGGFVDELNKLYSELATAKGFGRKLKDIETGINKAVAANRAKMEKENTKTENSRYIGAKVRYLEKKIESLEDEINDKYDSTPNIELDKKKVVVSAFKEKLEALNDGSVNFGNDKNIKQMYDKAKVAITYLKHIEHGHAKGLLTGKECYQYKKEFEKCFSDSLGKPRESVAAFEAKLKKIYAGAKKLRKERISGDYDTIIDDIGDMALGLSLSQIKNFAKDVFQADGKNSDEFDEALERLKDSVGNGVQKNENLTRLFKDKARELARTHFAGGKGSRKEFENKLGVLLFRAQEIQKAINNEKGIELNGKQKQRLFKLMDVSFSKEDVSSPKVYSAESEDEDVEDEDVEGEDVEDEDVEGEDVEDEDVEDEDVEDEDIKYEDGKFRSSLEKFEMDVGIQERPKRRWFGFGNQTNEIPQTVENNVDESGPDDGDPDYSISTEIFGNNDKQDPEWAEQYPNNEDPFMKDFEEEF